MEENLEKRITSIVNAAISKALEQKDNVQILSRQELCSRLKISLPTLDKWTAEGIIKGKIILGGRVRYKWTEVLESINDNAA